MKSRWTILASGSVLLALVVWSVLAHGHFSSSADRLLLLLPDGTNFSDPKVTLWLDAASEEGFHLVPIHDSDFNRPFFGQPQCAGVILPDSIHQKASDLFIASLRAYVAAGGSLMLVYDAGTLSPEGKYPRGGSRLSDLAGVNYAFYDRLHDQTTQWASVSSNSATVRQMEIPPGKYYPFEAGPGAWDSTAQGMFEVRLRRYKFGDLSYPSFTTSGNYAGKVLFQSEAGVVAGEHDYGKGSVLFVNVPVGYLKANTDGLLLHAFLKYFAGRILSLPSLISVPDGIGGMVLNWHVDSNAAIKPLEEMKSWTLLQQGRFSIHVTAGPDSTRFGDHDGFDVPHNRVSQQLIREHVARGDEIGSHGGWMHDYFAAHVDKDDPKTLERFLALNKSALEAVTGKPVVEYSAPDGNQPPWVTTWLDSHGFIAYYFTGDSGMGPTQGYRDGVREGRDVWAFPVVHLNQDAAFEEMARHGYSTLEVQDWLEAVAEFTADHQVARLIYFHPPGIMAYRAVVDNWMRQTSVLRAQQRFRWYTMTQLAKFLNSRKLVQWKASEQGERVVVEATHPQTLAHQTWRLPLSRFSEPTVVRGAAEVRQDSDAWMVVAGNGKELQFESKMVSK